MAVLSTCNLPAFRLPQVQVYVATTSSFLGVVVFDFFEKMLEMLEMLDLRRSRKPGFSASFGLRQGDLGDFGVIGVPSVSPGSSATSLRWLYLFNAPHFLLCSSFRVDVPFQENLMSL